MKAKQPAEDTEEVAAFMAALEHPLKTEIGAIRKIILGASPKIGEGIKWNAPSFRTVEYFATFHLRSTKEVQLVFHLGAKKRAELPEIKLEAPEGMVRWLAKDRCLVTMGKGKEVEAKAAALRAWVRGWIEYV
ncbi:MAG: DUF1801 domain-containing protein [Verrucomicrobiota bacterium]